MSDVFFCYRRNDNPQTAWHLARILNNTHETFLDTHIRGGEPWGDKLKNEIRDCTVFVCWIGENWLERKVDGSLRIDDPDDVVRQEIELALELRKKILPILVGEIGFPEKKYLPDKIKVILDLEFIKLRFVPPHFYNDAKEVTRRIDEIILEQKGHLYYAYRYIVKLIGRISMVVITAAVSAVATYFIMADTPSPRPRPDPPQPKQQVDRDDTILAKHTINIGYRASSAPLSYEKGGAVRGFIFEACGLLVEKAYPPDEVTPAFHPVSPSARIDALNKEIIDIECGSTSITPDREKEVSFIRTHIYTQIRFLSPEPLRLYNKKIEDMQDRELKELIKKGIIYVRGTTSLAALAQLKNLPYRREVADIPDLFNELRSSKADLAFLDDILLAGFLETYQGNEKYRLSAFASAVEEYGIMLPKDSPKLKAKLQEAWDDPAIKKKICRLFKETFLTGKIAPFINDIYDKRQKTGFSQADDLKSECGL